MIHTVKIKYLEHHDRELPLPSYKTNEAAGADLCACFADRGHLVLGPGDRVLIPTGLAMEIPVGFEIQVRPRSGLSIKTPLMILNAPGTIDSDYRGEVKVIMGNLGKEPVTINHGDRIAQIVFAPVIQANYVVTQDLSETERGHGGFGSTGESH